MELNKVLLASMIAASTALVGCGGDDDNDKKDTVKKPTTPPATGDVNQMTCTDSVCTVEGVFTEDLKMTADKTWAVKSSLFIGQGNKQFATAKEIADYQGPTLTIEPGTKILGAKGAAIVITRGSKIMANGEVDKPIHMTSSDEGTEGRGEWGGLVIQGKGITNKCTGKDVCNVSGEGNSGFYGGADNSDSSGTIKYVVVAEAGSVVGVDDELNGIGFMAVGSGTTVDYIQVHGNEDDGIEFWGGSVVAKHVVLTDNRDDSIDWDNGFVGGIQFAIVHHAADEGDHGMETDNNGSGMDLEPRSMPTLSNITLIGQSNSDTAIKHREGTGAKVYNSVVTGFPRCLDIDDAPTKEQIDTGLVYTNVVLDCAELSKATDSAKDDTGVVIPASVEDPEYATLLIGSQTSSVVTEDDIDGELTGYFFDQTAVANAPAIANSAITANKYFGATSSAADTWYKGWTVGAISK